MLTHATPRGHCAKENRPVSKRQKYGVIPLTGSTQAGQVHRDRNMHSLLATVVNQMFNLHLKPLDLSSN